MVMILSNACAEFWRLYVSIGFCAFFVKKKTLNFVEFIWNIINKALSEFVQKKNIILSQNNTSQSFNYALKTSIYVKITYYDLWL